MRDPLSRIQVRYKLPLAFAFLCLVAFGLGGYVVTSMARDSLSRQIQLRLNEHATSLNLAVEKSVELLGRRVEDFASDGFIRLELERLSRSLASGDEASAEAARDRLDRHLRVNKLPLVAEFVDAFLLDRTGRGVLRVKAGESFIPERFDRDSFWVGPLRGPSVDHPYPTFVLSTGVSNLQADAPLGYLQIVVRADTWADGLEQVLAFPGGTGFTARLSSPGGHGMMLVADPEGPSVESDSAPQGANDDRLRFTRRIARTGWELDLAVDRGILTIPINDLVLKFSYVGLALIVLTIFLVLFPRQFLLKPLSALQDAARRIAEGDFSARVECNSQDEVGDLAGGFNFMAAAIEERTRKLEQTAKVLERREADIRFERDRLNTVIRSMEDGLFILDATGRVTLANVASRPVIEGLSSAHGGSRLQCSRPETGAADCMQCIAESTGGAQRCVITLNSKIYEISGTVLPGPGEAHAGKVFVSRDVTARIRQAEIEAHREQLSVLGEIAAVMAHELNNPLAAISMFSQMLMKGIEPGSELRSHAEVIYRNTESCKETIRRLLDMATTAGGEPEEFDINQLVNDVRQLLAPIAQRMGVSVRFRIGAADPAVFGDELQIRQAIVNLVMNAIQACESAGQGDITVETTGGDGEVSVIVRDTGPGIPAEIREHIFEPFFTTKPPGDGTGLGLSTSRRIVDAQGGRLSLVTTGDDGTVFEIVLPRQGRRAAVSPDATRARNDRRVS